MKSSFLVSYDLHKPDYDYNGIEKAIRSYGTYCHLLKSVWVIDSNKSSEQIRDHLMNETDSGLSLAVFELTGVAHWVGIAKNQSDWLKNNLLFARSAS